MLIPKLPDPNDGIEAYVELAHVVCDPQPPPRIEVAFILNPGEFEIESICDRLEADLGFIHIHVQQLVKSLVHEKAGSPALGLLHPYALQDMLMEFRLPPAFFLLRILQHKLCRLIQEDAQRILISGFDDETETAILFAEKIAEPAAVFAFYRSNEEGSLSTAAIIRRYKNVAIEIEGSEEPEDAYGALLAAMGRIAKVSR